MTEHESGFEIAGYRIESVIGRGGMAVVYRAEDSRLGRKVALKLLSPVLAQNAQFQQRFIRESRLAASLDHPNIVPIYEAGEADGQLFIAMRYVVGSDLKALLKRESGPLPLARLLRLFVQIGDALDAAHQLGLVHRDVKPGNILVTAGQEQSGHAYSDHVYLTDFGLTKRATSLSGALTGTGHFLGTVDYVSPEQIQGAPVGPGTDIYALGCVLYECLTGQLPFHRDDDAALLWAHLVDTPPPVSGVRPDLPPAVDDVVARAMAKSPDERYASCHDLVRDLEMALDVSVPAPRTSQPLRTARAGPNVADHGGAPAGSEALDAGVDVGTQHPSFPPGSPDSFTAPAVDRYGELDADTEAVWADEDDGASDGAYSGAAPSRRRRWPLIILALAVVTAALGAGLYLARFRTSETPFRHYNSTDSVIEYSFDIPADWSRVEDASSAVVFSPRPDVVGSLFFSRGAGGSWAGTRQLLSANAPDAVGVYVYAQHSDLKGASPQDFQQFIKDLSPVDTTIGSSKHTTVTGAVTDELDAVIADPQDRSARLGAEIYVCQPAGGGFVLFTLVAAADDFVSQRPRFDKVMKSVQWKHVP
jgi:serine/threonine protein kinase